MKHLSRALKIAGAVLGVGALVLAVTPCNITQNIGGTSTTTSTTTGTGTSTGTGTGTGTSTSTATGDVKVHMCFENNLTDEMGHSCSPSTGITFDTALYQEGAASVILHGGDYFTFSDHADFKPSLGSKSLSIQFWVRFLNSPAGPGESYDLFTADYGPAMRWIQIHGASGGASELQIRAFLADGNAGTNTLSSGTLSANSWYRVLLVWNNSSLTWALFISSTPAGTWTTAFTPTFTNVSGPTVGRSVAGTPTVMMDDFYFTHDVLVR